MKKFYLVLLIALPFTTLHSQCPVINGALVNSCGTEGINEFVVFSTTTQTAVSNYVLYYGSSTPPATSPTNVLSGATARTQNGTGAIIPGSCNVIYVTSPATVIPALSTVVFIPSNFDNTYNIAPLCTGGTIYVVLLDITVAPNVWNANGTLANSPAAARYLQVKNGQTDCTLGIRTYENGWASNADGNFVTWDLTGTATYTNGGCDLVTTPVKLISFSAVAAGKNANIAWQTASEVNAKSFELERSVDGNNFATIYTTAAAGHSSVTKNYAFTDLDLASGASYYRLKMIDADGAISYSKIAKVISTKTGFVITNVYPKPAVSQLGISFNASRSGKTIASVYDFSGRKLMTGQITTNTGMNFYQLQVSNLPKGAYMLKLEKDGETAITNFTRQ